MNNNHQERIQPQNIEAEQAVLGAMLLSREAIDTIFEIPLDVDSFYGAEHKKIFKAITELYSRTEPVDILTVSAELKKSNWLDDVGGRAYIAGLTEASPSIANAEFYGKLVLEKATLNNLIGSANTILSKAYDTTQNVNDILDMAEQDILAIREHKLRKSAEPIGFLIAGAMQYIELAGQGKIMGLPSGFAELDHLTSGFQLSDMILIACRPSVGKTSLALNIIDHLSIDRKVPGLIFSLEMSKEQLALRLLCSRARVSTHKIRNGWKLSADELTNLSNAYGALDKAPLFIDDSPTITVLEMRAKARRLKARENIGIVIVDYLQLIGGPSNAENRQQEITFISRQIKAMARELCVPVIALSQLSRQVEMRGKDAKPQLSDLRESGSLEQDSDAVIFIHRPRDTEGHHGAEAEIIIAKQRNGPTGSVDMVFLKDYARFEPAARNMTQPEKDYYKGD